MLPIVLSVISGILLILSQPPFNLGHISWFCLIPLFIALNGKTLRQSLLYGFITGIVYFLGILYWVFPIMMPVTILGGTLLVIYLSLFFAVFSLLFRLITSRYPDSPLRYVLCASFLWVSFEYLRTIGVLGFPWGLIAYSQWKNTTLIQIADITGVYGISFVVALFNAALAYLIYQYRPPFEVKRLSAKGMTPLSIFLIGVIIFVFFYGMRAISVYEPLIEIEKKKVDIALIQGNIDQSKKWDHNYLGESLGIYMGMTGELKSIPDLIVWPETAITVSLNENKFLEEAVCKFARSTKTFFLSGVQETEEGKYFNRAILITPDGNALGKYDKIHLVPFSEATPYFFKWIFPFLKKVIPGEDFTKGKEYTVFNSPLGNFSCCICFESIFPQEIRRFTKNGAQFLINLTNDAWFGKTGAPYQHFAINVFRAVENRMEIARAANSGISGYINMIGQPQYVTSIFTRCVIYSKLKLRTTQTIYTRFGDVFSWICLIASFFFIIGTGSSNLMGS